MERKIYFSQPSSLSPVPVCSRSQVLSDFGLGRDLGPGASHATTRLAGSSGYMDPLYHESHQVTLASDMWSFGVRRSGPRKTLAAYSAF